MRISFKSGDCPECGDEGFLPSRTRGIENISKVLLPFNPYRCSVCNTRFWAPRSFKSYFSNFLYILVFLGLIFLLVSQQRLNKTIRQQTAAQQNATSATLGLSSTPMQSEVSAALNFERELDALQKVDDEVADTLVRNDSLSVPTITTTPTSTSSNDTPPALALEPELDSLFVEKPLANQKTLTNSQQGIVLASTSPPPQTVDIVEHNGEEAFLPQLAGLESERYSTDRESVSAKSTVVTLPADLQKMVLTQLDNWRDAWQTQNVARYLASYSFRFKSEKGESFAIWRKQRAGVLQRPEWIRVAISEPTVSFSQDEKTATVAFTQDYAASNYQDVSRKTITLSREGNNWNIIREQSQ